MKKEKIFIFICLVLLSACSPSSLDGIVIEKAADGYKLSIDGRETYIKGVGGTYRLDIAAQSGANAFRTWGGNAEEIKKLVILCNSLDIEECHIDDIVEDFLTDFKTY